MNVVKLDDPPDGGGPGTVIAHVDTVRDYYAMVTDRDGAVDDAMRLWGGGDFPIGSRVSLGTAEDHARMLVESNKRLGIKP